MNESTRKQLQIAIERAVRPVKVGWWRQDQIREELLAHVTGIFEEEFARLGDEAAASHEALRRFGEPSKLTDEWNAARTLEDRVAYVMECWYGWRAPESAARYMLRLCVRVFFTIVSSIAVPLTIGEKIVGSTNNVSKFPSLWIIPCLVCGAIFPLGWLYFQMRDSMFGFCSPRSWPRAAGYGALFALTFFMFGLASATLGAWSWQEGWNLMTPHWLIVSAVAPFVALALARWRGPAEIRHTEWSSLQLN